MPFAREAHAPVNDKKLFDDDDYKESNLVSLTAKSQTKGWDKESFL